MKRCAGGVGRWIGASVGTFVLVAGIGCTSKQPASGVAPGTVPARPRCDGCLQEGACVQGTSANACGSGGRRCETCEPNSRCIVGNCQKACDSSLCPNGCCRNGICRSGTDPENCGDLGMGCYSCSGEEVCYDGECVSTKLRDCLRKVHSVREACFSAADRLVRGSRAQEDAMIMCNARGDARDERCRYFFQSQGE